MILLTIDIMRIFNADAICNIHIEWSHIHSYIFWACSLTIDIYISNYTVMLLGFVLLLTLFGYHAFKFILYTKKKKTKRKQKINALFCSCGNGGGSYMKRKTATEKLVEICSKSGRFHRIYCEFKRPHSISTWKGVISTFVVEDRVHDF